MLAVSVWRWLILIFVHLILLLISEQGGHGTGKQGNLDVDFPDRENRGNLVF